MVLQLAKVLPEGIHSLLPVENGEGVREEPEAEVD
jgi:hypothetical protein